MIIYLAIESIEESSLDYLLAGLLILCLGHVWWECRKLNEPMLANLFLSALFCPFHHLLWTLWWPGTLRRRILKQPAATSQRSLNPKSHHHDF